MMRRATSSAARQALPVAAQQQRGVRYVPEWEMRRPANSSKSYRAVQDWKPLAHEVAHKAGKDLEVDEETCMMYMILIDGHGYRWPVRFKLKPAMTLVDLFHECDARWFDVLPDDMLGMGATPRASLHALYYGKPMAVCHVNHPQTLRCNNCLVYLPYEYLDAMSPPNVHEVRWMRKVSDKHGYDIQANARMACQVFIEDWMDGMTVVLPQRDSTTYQLYYQHGVDKASMDQGWSFSSPHNTAPQFSDGYLAKSEDDKKKEMKYTESILDFDTSYDRGQLAKTMPELSFGNWGGTSLREVFWMNNVDDVIRTKDPKWKGYYEFLNK